MQQMGRVGAGLRHPGAPSSYACALCSLPAPRLLWEQRGKHGAGGVPRELLIFNQTRRLGWQLTRTGRHFFGSAVLCQGCDGSSSAGWSGRERSWQGAVRRRRAPGSGGSAKGREMTGALWSPDKDFGGGNTQQISAPGASSTVAQQPVWGSIFVCPRGAGFSRGSMNPLCLPCSH